MGEEEKLQPRLPPAVEEALRCEEQFERVDRFTIISHWERPRSGTSFFRLRPTPPGPDLVVKMEAADRAAAVGLMRDAMVHLDEVITAAAIPAGHGLRPLAVLEDPPLLVTPYIDGEDLVSIARRPDDPAWDAWMPDWMTRAGAMIAAYHRSYEPPDSDDMARATEEAREAARRLRLRTQHVDRLMAGVDLGLLCRPAYGDFGPGNLLGTANGDLYLLDPPVNPPYALIHRDLANFVFELRRQLAGHGFTRHPPVKGRFSELLTNFLAGYSNADHPLGHRDLGLMSLFEARRALGMARKRLPWRIPDVAWFTRLALTGRQKVIRASTQRVGRGA